MSLVTWVVWGLVVGAIARLLVPGRQALGLLWTLMLGVLGSLVGGLVATEALHVDTIGSFGPGSFAIAVGTSTVLLFAYERVVAFRERRRHPGGPRPRRT
jgi:uncharacterized membrane protein YeaQ/YmgE (transglycosylase-associated protein family)